MLPSPHGQNLCSAVLAGAAVATCFAPGQQIAAAVADGPARLVELRAVARDTPFLNGADALAKEISGFLLVDEAVQIVTSTRRASISSLQRRMRIGYNRAARIIEDMETSGIVSSMNSAGNRDVLAPEPIEPDDN